MPAAELPAAEAPAAEAPAAELPAAELPTGETPAPEAIPVEVPAAEAAVAEAPATESTPPSAEEPVTEPAPAVAVEEPVPPTLVPTRPAVAPAPVLSARTQERAFQDFTRAGLSTAAGPIKAPAMVVRVANAASRQASNDEEVIVAGTHPRGKAFAAYRNVPGSCMAKYVALLAVDRPADSGNMRAIVKRSSEGVMAGDLLYPVDDLRAEYERQRGRAGASGGKPVLATVGCFPEDRRYQARSDDTFVVDRGSADGVSMAWLCEVVTPGKDQPPTYGRVVKVTPHASFVTIMKVYAPVQVGDQTRLSERPLTTSVRGARAR
ncbi:MAG: hypothetical protein AAB152_17170 [Candidatus Coatesbacteria bacterium]